MTNRKEVRAAGYIRVSQERAVRNGYGLSAQEHEIKRFIEYKGYTYVDIYRENGVSGYTRERPAMDRLLADASPYIMIDTEGVVKLTDFGIAKARNLMKDKEGDVLMKLLKQYLRLELTTLIIPGENRLIAVDAYNGREIASLSSTVNRPWNSTWIRFVKCSAATGATFSPSSEAERRSS